jgi:hypothetical protein
MDEMVRCEDDASSVAADDRSSSGRMILARLCSVSPPMTCSLRQS